MIDEFEWLLRQYDQRQETPVINQEESFLPQTRVEDSAITSDTKRQKCNKTDIDILRETYGELTDGKEIVISLPEACKLLNRTRIRIDAFKTLQKNLLKEFGTTLKITSRKTH